MDANGNILTDAVTDVAGQADTTGFQVELAGTVTQNSDTMTVIKIKSTVGQEMKTYTVTVTRNKARNDPSLATLTATPVGGNGLTLDPDPTGANTLAESLDYNVTSPLDIGTPNTPTMVTVEATSTLGGKADIIPADASMVEGHQVGIIPGRNTIRVMVTAEDGTTMRSYTVTITRGAATEDPTLSGLMLSDGATLTPEFSSNELMYTASVAHTVSRITVTPTKVQTAATIGYMLATDADVAMDGHQVNLSDGENEIRIMVTAPGPNAGVTTDDVVLTYTVRVTRMAAPPVGDAVTAPMVTNSPRDPGAGRRVYDHIRNGRGAGGRHRSDHPGHRFLSWRAHVLGSQRGADSRQRH